MQWLMNNLNINEGDTIQLRRVTLPRATYIKLQPHTADFLEVNDTKAMLDLFEDVMSIPVFFIVLTSPFKGGANSVVTSLSIMLTAFPGFTSITLNRYFLSL